VTAECRHEYHFHSETGSWNKLYFGGRLCGRRLLPYILVFSFVRGGRCESSAEYPGEVSKV